MEYHLRIKKYCYTQEYGLVSNMVAKWKKPELKQYILYDSIYVKLWERQNYSDRRQNSGLPGQAGGRLIAEDYRELSGVMDVLYQGSVTSVCKKSDK